MPILQTHAVPHPPLLVPAVGRGRVNEVNKTFEAMESVASAIAGVHPDLVIFITPHGKVYDDYLHISPGSEAFGNLGNFGAPQEKYHLIFDTEFITALNERTESESIYSGTLGGKGGDNLDHGVMVPLHFIQKMYSGFKSVRLSISGLSLETHYRMGLCIQKTVDALGRKAVIIASGDLSHKLTKDGPYGFSAEGPVFDKKICECLKTGDFLSLMELDPALCEKAAECGLRSFVVMAGVLDGRDVNINFHSYQGPFGVGYAVCSFEPKQENENRRFLSAYETNRSRDMDEKRKNEGDYVRLARYTLEGFVKTGIIDFDLSNWPKEIFALKAGVFVSIKKDGKLRGCIGTTEPTRPTLAEEIMANAISAGTKDSRFDPVVPEELPLLVYSVDILSPAEPINGPEALDVYRYGVIVTSGYKRGLLLPNLETVDTVEQQVSIAMQKAGIKAGDNYTLQRFEVVRHT